MGGNVKKILLCVQLFILACSSKLCAESAVEEYPVVILGGGVGALTSAVYLSRAGITPVVITGPTVGGTITQSHNVQNWPGEISIPGVELGEKVKDQAEKNGAVLLSEAVVSVDFSKRPFLITTQKIAGTSESQKRYRANAVIIAMGATPNLLHVPGESGEGGYWSNGVYSCAVCDGFLYKDKTVSVVGGGDGALVEAQYLANIASKVHLLVRRDEFRAVEKERLKEILAHPKIEVHYQTVVKEIKGNGEKATHLVLLDVAKQKTWELQTDALFLAIGARPNTDFFRNQIELDPMGYIVLKKFQQTSVEGVYAIGDVADPEFKQAVSAAGDAAKAALQAQKFLASLTSVSERKDIPLAKETTQEETRHVIEISSKEHFDNELRDAAGVVFVDFYSTYCGPCRTFSPMYDEWANRYGNRIKFLKVNADSCEEIFAKYQIRVVPTLVILDQKGNVIRKSIGFREIAEVERRLEKFGDKAALTAQDFS